MAISFTYTSLRQSLQNWVEDDDEDFTDNLDTIIGMGEQQLLRDLDLELFEGQGTATAALGTNTLTKPAGYITARTLDYLALTGALVYLQPRTVEYLKDYTNSAGPGDPLFVAELNETQWMIAPVPARAITVNLRYTKRPAGLSSLIATTWLSTNAADALFYACLANTEEFLKSDERLAVWKAKYHQEILPRTKREISKIAKVDYHLRPEASAPPH